MKTSDRAEFALIYGALAKHYGADLSGPMGEACVEIVFDVLAPELELAEFRTVARQALRTLKFMPKASEFLELAHGRTEDLAELAWVVALETAKNPPWPMDGGRLCLGRLSFEDVRINAAVRSCAGDWRQFATIASSVDEPIGVLKAHFVRAFGAFVREGTPAALAEPHEPSLYLGSKNTMVDYGDNIDRTRVIDVLIQCPSAARSQARILPAGRPMLTLLAGGEEAV